MQMGGGAWRARRARGAAEHLCKGRQSLGWVGDLQAALDPRNAGGGNPLEVRQH